MADFVAVLKKTIDGLGDTTPATRQKVYDKARATISAKLAAISPPPAPAVVERQKRALEDAIASVEKDYSTPPADDPLAELENVFASLKNPQPRGEPAWQAPKANTAPEPKADAWAKPQQTAVRPAPRPAPPAPPPSPAVAEQIPTVGGAARDDDAPFTELRGDAPRAQRRSHAGLIAVGIVLAVVAGAGYGVWLNRDAFASLFGGAPTEIAATQPAAEQPPAAQQPAEAAPPEPTPAEQPAQAASAESEPKFTQRLMPDGSEVDEGGGSGMTGVGEGTSVAAVTQLPGTPANSPATTPAPAEGNVPPATPQAPAAAPAAAPEQRQTVAVGQRAIFYEERTNATEGSAELGTIVWSLVQESPGGNQPAEPAIRAEAIIPGKDLQLRMTIRRNADQSLPASHILEMIFLTPEGFGGGGIDNILRVALKGSEQEAGSPLLGIPAKIADGFFLVALTDGKAEIDANLGLLRRQSWIDIPVVYKTGRRALITMEKGIPGDKVFQDAIAAWQAASAG